ncbi:GNAT family N-acetyltransferase [Anoxybacillus flavithermus]|uniref:GNAT family N-acetyltransferase n=1 Tax=Anoxybacillus flavithermus TaxID=33934 RepID=UPI0007D9A943|nr:GNAT family protein [Anoxybacillus flavithermus]MBE2914517.1 GNAT family N-acetyltransferase [Anoxybacillus flavithermus]MBE2941669.1 GNAT family N-acetyltransferase [Anoxybacillus flavithermus]MBE2944354.1 GNAT family N-acetyltransferase [Anoxybacillus flavithermus]MBE2952555.1 GNAT family N-acetyltransferase [Anoxybacillus flavithermus]MBE2955248.1 GNAT family N-acetyltransferase [Anoxybacillus flavithermus]
MIIREARLEDAQQLANLIQQVENESEFMLFEPGERKLTPEKQRTMIENISKQKNSTIFVAEDHEKLVGYLMAFGGNAKRNRHSVYLVVGILKEHRGKGVGTELFRKLESWARERKIHRLELTVMTQNQAGIALYKKMGFEIEGIKKHSLLVNGRFMDEYYMAKILY